MQGSCVRVALFLLVYRKKIADGKDAGEAIAGYSSEYLDFLGSLPFLQDNYLFYLYPMYFIIHTTQKSRSTMQFPNLPSPSHPSKT